MQSNDRAFLYGKNPLQNVVSVDIQENTAHIWREIQGEVNKTEMPFQSWILYNQPVHGACHPLSGNLTYKWAEKFNKGSDYYDALLQARRTGKKFWTPYNFQEMFLLKEGVTYFKGLKVSEVSVLSFDIETTGIVLDETSKVLLIANTFRRGRETIRKLFRYDDYNTNKELVDAWCEWVREIDPSIIIGHNIYGFDFGYLRHVAGGRLQLGRGGQEAVFSERASQFRKDGSQKYDYNNVLLPGREVVDTFFLAIKYDIARQYPSYGLKAIIKHEGLERKDRQHFDASQIAKTYQDPDKWAEICKYAEHDADDALALYDLMIPSFFYYAQSIPKTLQQIINGASGSQVNAFLVRSYLQNGHSLPEASEPHQYEGGISFGNPGIYQNVYKVDVASLYPSVIRHFKIHDPKKDPNAHFLKMVEIFTVERLANKQRAKETGDRYYKDLEQSQKLLINSAYGFMGAPGLLFNAPHCAEAVTRHGREILQQGLSWAAKMGYQVINADTDSFSYCQDEERPFERDIEELNSHFPELIRWENDGYYSVVVIVKAKNYVLVPNNGKPKIKGSALKATMKEPALAEFLRKVIEDLVQTKGSELRRLYDDYAMEALKMHDITRWASKKTVTKSVLHPKRTQEARIKAAIGERPVSEGDKIHVFFKTPVELALVQDFDGTYDRPTLLKKLHNTMKIFSTLIDMKEFPNYSLKKYQKNTLG